MPHNNHVFSRRPNSVCISVCMASRLKGHLRKAKGCPAASADRACHVALFSFIVLMMVALCRGPYAHMNRIQTLDSKQVSAGAGRHAAHLDRASCIWAMVLWLMASRICGSCTSWDCTQCSSRQAA